MPPLQGHASSMRKSRHLTKLDEFEQNLSASLSPNSRLAWSLLRSSGGGDRSPQGSRPEGRAQGKCHGSKASTSNKSPTKRKVHFDTGPMSSEEDNGLGSGPSRTDGEEWQQQDAIAFVNQEEEKLRLEIEELMLEIEERKAREQAEGQQTLQAGEAENAQGREEIDEDRHQQFPSQRPAHDPAHHRAQRSLESPVQEKKGASRMEQLQENIRGDLPHAKSIFREDSNRANLSGISASLEQADREGRQQSYSMFEDKSHFKSHEKELFGFPNQSGELSSSLAGEPKGGTPMRSLISLAYDSDTPSSPDVPILFSKPESGVAQDADQQKLENDIRVTDLELEIKNLNAKLRILQSESPKHSQAFELYETEITSLSKQLAESQQQIVRLLLPLATPSSMPSSMGRSFAENGSSLSSAHAKRKQRGSVAEEEPAVALGESFWKNSLRKGGPSPANPISETLRAEPSFSSSLWTAPGGGMGGPALEKGIRLLAKQLHRSQQECTDLKKKERRFRENEAFISQLMDKLKRTSQALRKRKEEVARLQAHAKDDSAAWQQTKRHQLHAEKMSNKIKLLETRLQEFEIKKSSHRVYHAIRTGARKRKQGGSYEQQSLRQLGEKIKTDDKGVQRLDTSTSADENKDAARAALVDSCEATLEDLAVVDSELKASEKMLGPDGTHRGPTQTSRNARQAIRRIRKSYVETSKQRMNSIRNEKQMLELLYKIKVEYNIAI